MTTTSVIKQTLAVLIMVEFEGAEFCQLANKAYSRYSYLLAQGKGYHRHQVAKPEPCLNPYKEAVSHTLSLWLLF